MSNYNYTIAYVYLFFVFSPNDLSSFLAHSTLICFEVFCSSEKNNIYSMCWIRKLLLSYYWIVTTNTFLKCSGIVRYQNICCIYHMKNKSTKMHEYKNRTCICTIKNTRVRTGKIGATININIGMHAINLSRTSWLETSAPVRGNI